MDETTTDTGYTTNTTPYESQAQEETDSSVGSRRRTFFGREEPTNRKIYINRNQPESFVSNYVTTAKYTFWSFIPAFLYEQFRRYSNIFFLAIGLLQQLPDVSPTGKYTTIFPLFVILLVSAVKEIIEDIKRHDADKEVNNREVEVLKQGDWRLTKWMNVCVGDFVRVKNEKPFPADLVLFSSSDIHGLCYIETANLDGETNLKVRQGLPETVIFQDTSDYVKMTGTVTCELPNRHLYEFVGNLSFNRGPELPLHPDQLLLRGAKLQNTNWIIGLAIYTGPDTKLRKNSTAAPLKRSTVDKQTNTQILFLFAFLLIVSVLSSALSLVWVDKNKVWYIPPASNTKNASFWEKTVVFTYNFFTFLILYNNLIPISLTVTLEIVRFIQALFINWDDDLRYEETDTPAMARTSNLNEELGQVRYVFSDKTGTLTRNIMEFKACTIAGVVYSPESLSGENNLLLQNLKGPHETVGEIKDFLLLLAVCHTVIPDYSTGELVYHAASPDERALVLGGKRFGYEFLSRTPKTVEIDAGGTKEVYEILNVLEFTSTRKRMSIIVKSPSGKIRLFCKGADNVIYERLVDDKAMEPRKASTKEHLQDFANQGLRTLCCAVTEINPQAYEQWNEIFRKAATSIQNREAKLEDASNLIEKNLWLLGATAIEDKLQDNVPETIDALLKAGIHVWVLTGDKQETAINIGHSCKLLSLTMNILLINNDSSDATRETLLRHRRTLGLKEVNSTIPTQPHNAAIIIDGTTLKYAIAEDLRKMFIQLCCSCKAVICCRASPLQKAEIVEYVTEFTGKVTLAIGDGANDVAMIQKAHVGIGISGQEGLQAACASDYAIAQFHFLRKLLFVHGAWNYDRLCKVIFYSYYKNICLYIVELWFAMYSAWSGQIIFERWTIGLYNMIFTCAQPICIGLFERNCSEQLRMKYPSIYHPTDNPFGMRRFFTWIMNSLVHSAILFWLTWWICGHGIVWEDGKEGGYLVLGNFIYTYVVVVVSLKSGLVTKSWTTFTFISIWGSIFLWMIFLYAYSNLFKIVYFGAEIFGIGVLVFTSPVFWAGLIIVPSAALLPDLVLLAIQTTLRPTKAERFRQCDKLQKDPSVDSKPEKLEQVEDHIRPTEYSFFDLNSIDESSEQGSSSPSTTTSSPEDTKSDSAPQSDNDKKNMEGKGDGRVEPDGDKPTPIEPPKKTPPPGTTNKLKMKLAVNKELKAGITPKLTRAQALIKNVRFYSKEKMNGVKESKSLGAKRVSVSENQSRAQMEVYPTKYLTQSSSTHPAVHPSLLRTRTKLETFAPNSGRSPGASDEQAELRKLFKRWVASNNKHD